MFDFVVFAQLHFFGALLRGSIKLLVYKHKKEKKKVVVWRATQIIINVNRIIINGVVVSENINPLMECIKLN